MSEFEVGKWYPMKKPGNRGRVMEITEDNLLVIHARSGSFFPHGWDGRIQDRSESEYDLLLPAIEPEEAPAGMHPRVRQALVSMADLWGAFAGDIQTGLVDPCSGGCFQLDGARIACGYQSREAALAECRQIIESIDHLLEGRSHD